MSIQSTGIIKIKQLCNWMRHGAIAWTLQKENNIRIVDQYADAVAVQCKTKEQRTWRKSPCHKRFSRTKFEQAESDSRVRYSISGIDCCATCYINTINDQNSRQPNLSFIHRFLKLHSPKQSWIGNLILVVEM